VGRASHVSYCIAFPVSTYLLGLWEYWSAAHGDD
jgi:hypothetical protein